MIYELVFLIYINYRDRNKVSFWQLTKFDFMKIYLLTYFKLIMCNKILFGEKIKWITITVTTANQEKCIKSHVLTVELKQKFHSNQMANDQFTVAIVTKNESQEDIRNNILIKKSSWNVIFYRLFFILVFFYFYFLNLFSAEA